MFIGIEGIARKVTGAHIGVDGVARKVKKAYIGVDGVARLAWEADGGYGEPRAYLYNGMELPPLPQWDKKEYPYACIARSALGLYTFGASKSPVLVYNGNNGKPRCDWNPPYLRSTIWANSDKWPELQYEEDFTGSDLSSDISMWANYDIEYNGEVIVTASEPVPVYI